MKLNEIKRAVLNGYKVCWANEGYDVVHHAPTDQWSVNCNLNNYNTGLTWTDGKTMNEPESRYFIALGGKSFRFRDEVRPILKGICEQLAAVNLIEDEAWSRQSSDPARDGVYGMLHKAMMRIVELETHAEVVRDIDIDWSAHGHCIDDIEVAVEAELTELAEAAGSDEGHHNVMPEPPASRDPFKGIPVHVNSLEKPTTLFIPIPKQFTTIAMDGKCQCDYCKAHPDQPARWDTICISYDDKGDCTTGTVHFPECSKTAPLREFLKSRKRK